MWQSTAYGKVTGADPDDLAADEARNGFIHVLSLLLTKTADGVIDPKLVLSSVLSSLGTPAAFMVRTTVETTWSRTFRNLAISDCR